MAWGDYDGDGDLDLVVGGSRSRLYRSDNGTLTASAVWSSSGSDNTVAWGDYDGDGDLDLAVGNFGQPNRLYRNELLGLKELSNYIPRVTMVRPVSHNANFFSITPTLSSPIIPLTYTLSDPEGDPVRFVRAYYSPDGGGKWYTATAASGTITTNLTATPSGTKHIFNWDTFASGFFGQSDNVVFRIEAYPSLKPLTNSVPVFQRPYASSTTFPFRVRGTQVRVVQDTPTIQPPVSSSVKIFLPFIAQNSSGVGSVPAPLPATNANALVYRLPTGLTRDAQPIANSAGQPFHTDGQGYLQGRGQLNLGDRLVALLPLTATESYTLYATSAAPTLNGLALYTVTAPGVQTLTVSANNLLMLFNLDVSLEWDARTDAQFMVQPSGALMLSPVSAGQYSGTFNLSRASFVGYVQVWVDEPEPRREVVADYSLGGNPAYLWADESPTRDRGAYLWADEAPATSADGQVVLYGDNLVFAENGFVVLQAATQLVSPPSWATLVGQAYWLSKSAAAPSLAGTSISFRYAGSEVPPGEENLLRVYVWNGVTWQKLSTNLDTYQNTATAPTQGEGLYALLSTIEIPLGVAGWNLLAYPVQGTRPVTLALASINGSYGLIYGYNFSDATDPWKLYAPTVPTYVNDLHVLEFGHAYWISVTQPITLLLKGGSTTPRVQSNQSPPATYYGVVQAGSGFTPTAGMSVMAYVNSTICGQGQTQNVGGQIVYHVNVFAAGNENGGNCGVLGRTVTFQVGARVMTTTAAWDDRRVWNVILAP